MERIFNVLKLYYLQIFTHEMGHAFVYKLITNRNSHIRIFTTQCNDNTVGNTTYEGQRATLGHWESTFVSAAGVFSSIAFNGIQLCVLSKFLGKIFQRKPQAALFAGFILSREILRNIVSEFLYAFSNRKDGDFANIAKRGALYVRTARLAILSELAFFLALCTRLFQAK